MTTLPVLKHLKRKKIQIEDDPGVQNLLGQREEVTSAGLDSGPGLLLGSTWEPAEVPSCSAPCWSPFDITTTVKHDQLVLEAGDPVGSVPHMTSTLQDAVHSKVLVSWFQT